jgi:hypothetical protein
MGLASKLQQQVKPISDMVEQIITPEMNKEVKKRVRKLKKKLEESTMKGGALLSKAKAALIIREAFPKLSDEIVQAFIDSKHKKRGWNASKDTIMTTFNEFYDNNEYQNEILLQDEKREKADEKETTVARERGVFKLTEKEFTLLRHSNPKYEWRQLLKSFFNEMSITGFSKIPAGFVSDVNALKLKGSVGQEKLDKLVGIINAYRPSVQPESNKAKIEVELPVVKKPVKKPKKRSNRAEEAIASDKVEVKLPLTKEKKKTTKKKPVTERISAMLPKKQGRKVLQLIV